MEPWGIQTIQYVIFRDDAALHKASSLFQQFAGEEPDHIQNNKTLSAAANFHSLANGVVEDRFYQTTVQPGRIDFQVSCPDRPTSGPWAWKLNDGLRHLKAHLDRVIARRDWLQSCTRVSIPVTLLRNVAKAEEASTFIAEHLGEMEFRDMVDVMVQANSPVFVEGLSAPINRLMRFSTSQVQELVMQVDSDGSPRQVGQSVSRHLASCLLDVNTVPSGQRFTDQQAAEMFLAIGSIVEALAVDGTISAIKAK